MDNCSESCHTYGGSCDVTPKLTMFAFFILGNLHDITASFVVVKFLACINVDIGIFDDIKLNVTLFWLYL